MPQSAQFALTPLRCELCGGPMKLIRRIPAVGTQPQSAHYQCEKCGHTISVPVRDEAR
jgi:hypothetical protein